MRLGVYIDFTYRRDDDGISTDEAVVLFVTAFASHVGEVVLFGRLHPEPGRAPYALPSDGVRFVPLAHYPSVSSLRDVGRAVRRSCRSFAAELDRLDAVWLFGPHPISLAFAALALRHRTPVFNGIRQDFPLYIARRLPSRRWLWAVPAARGLDWAYRQLARRVPTLVVGAELAEKYRADRQRSVLPIEISLARRGDLVPASTAVNKDWNGELRVLSVGRLDPEKNPTLLADVLAQLREDDPRWRMDVAGTGPMEDALRRRAGELGVAESLRLLGYVPNGPELNRLYRGAHAFLHVSFTEGLPQVLVEAQAAGLPIVATDVGGVSAALAGGASGLLVPADDADAATGALLRLRDDPALRAALIEEGLTRAEAATMESAHERVAAFMRERVRLVSA
jgi:glycosyltransferase involved in cell wall biosynthesis